MRKLINAIKNFFRKFFGIRKRDKVRKSKVLASFKVIYNNFK